jgi:hypothetical protein
MLADFVSMICRGGLSVFLRFFLFGFGKLLG